MSLFPDSPALSPARRWFAGYGLFAALVLLWLLSVFGAYWFDNILAWTPGLLYVAYDTWLIAYVAWHTRRLGLDTPAATTLTGTVPLGVIIPARNEASVIAATLEAVLPQTLAGDTILLVDDGSTDGTRALLSRHYGIAYAGMGVATSSRHPSLKVLFKNNTGKADSLNVACALLTQEVVVTLDADTRAAPGSLARFREAFAREPQLVAACGILTPQCTGLVEARLFEQFQFFEYLRAFLSRAAWMKSNALLLVSGAFAAYRRDALRRVGGYDPHCLVEDYELIHRLHRYAHEHGLDWRVRVLSEPRASTDAPADLLTFLRQRRRWFAGFLQTQFSYRQLHGDARYGAIGTLMLPVKAVDALQPVFGLTAFVLLLLILANNATPAPAVLAVIGMKLLIDFGYHLWAVRLYHRWLGLTPPPRIWGRAIFATLAEPFSFQLLRHVGAAWGWVQTLTGNRDWAPQRRPQAVSES